MRITYSYPKPKPSIWVTWVSKLMAGETQCSWSSWKKTHFNGLNKVPSNFDQSTWVLNHTSLINEITSELMSENKKYTIENQNYFSLAGKSGVMLSGKPDVISYGDNQAKVIDAKTGSPKASDKIQILIYLFAMSQQKDFAGLDLSGVVIYSDHRVEIPFEQVNEKFTNQLFSVLKKLSSNNEPQTTPSYDECKFCDLSQIECGNRIDNKPETLQTEVLSF